MNNHTQAAHINGAFNDNKEYSAHHNNGLNNIRPDDSLQATNSGVKYADNADHRRDYMYIYTSHCKITNSAIDFDQYQVKYLPWLKANAGT